MLKTVAQEMVRQFGIKDSYRIGGDEFVAFVVDEPPRTVRERMSQLVANVEANGYSVAVGCATCSAGGIQLEASSSRPRAACTTTRKNTTAAAVSRTGKKG